MRCGRSLLGAALFWLSRRPPVDPGHSIRKVKLSRGNFETFCPKAIVVPAHFCIGALVVYPPSPPTIEHRRGRRSRVRSTAACGGLPLTARPGCATPPGTAGDISSRAAPFPMNGKGRGDWGERAVKPLIFHGWTVSI